MCHLWTNSLTRVLNDRAHDKLEEMYAQDYNTNNDDTANYSRINENDSPPRANSAIKQTSNLNYGVQFQSVFSPAARKNKYNELASKKPNIAPNSALYKYFEKNEK